MIQSSRNLVYINKHTADGELFGLNRSSGLLIVARGRAHTRCYNCRYAGRESKMRCLGIIRAAAASRKRIIIKLHFTRVLIRILLSYILQQSIICNIIATTMCCNRAIPFPKLDGSSPRPRCTEKP